MTLLTTTARASQTPAGYLDVACSSCGDALFLPVNRISHEPPLCPSCERAESIAYELWSLEKVLNAIESAEAPFDCLNPDERRALLAQYAPRFAEAAAPLAPATVSAVVEVERTFVPADDWTPDDTERSQIEDEDEQQSREATVDAYFSELDAACRG